MATVKTTRPVGGHDAGTELDVTEGAAAILIDSNYAELVTKPKGKAKTETKTPAESPSTNEGGGASPAESGTTAG